jgi:hypothetical protein
MKVEHGLSAPSARRDQPAPVVPRRGDRQKGAGPSSGSRTQDNEFCARPAGEVIDIHSGVDPAGGIHRSRSDRVVGVVSERGSKILGRCDN